MKRSFPFTPVFLAMLFLCGIEAADSKVPASDKSAPRIDEIATGYKSYRRMTAEGVFVNPELAMLCIGATRSQVEAARKSSGPHAHSAILVYMNEIAARDFSRGENVYAPGAVIVKQKTLLGHRDGSSGTWVGGAENGIGGMVKRSKGYDPAHGDWEYFYFEDPQKIESGRIASCVKCHEGARAKDYVFGGWAKSGKKS